MATWAPQLGSPAPPARDSTAMVYDDSRGVAFLFGGQDFGMLVPATNWEWDGTAWTEIVPAAGPPGRWQHAMAYDSARQRVVLFGGADIAGMQFADTWEY